jgi:hypothetical protein
MESADAPLPIKRRITRAPLFRITERDISVVAAVHHYRMLERRQIEYLFFGGGTNTNRARERLRLLYQHGYLERIARPIYPTIPAPGPVYRLSARGAKLLAERTGTSLRQFFYWGRGDDTDARKTQVTPLFLEHGLILADVRMALEKATIANDCTIELWRDEAEFRHTREWDTVVIEPSPGAAKTSMRITPDGYFAIRTRQGRGHFFLEVDRSTERIKDVWQRKIVSYKAYAVSDQFRRRYHITQPDATFRVLTTTLSLARAEHLKAAAERYGSPQAAVRFLFAPLFDVMAHDPLAAPIWLRGGNTGPQALL